MKECIIIHNTVVKARRDTYKSGMTALRIYKDNKRMLQQFVFDCYLREEMRGKNWNAAD